MQLFGIEARTTATRFPPTKMVRQFSMAHVARSAKRNADGKEHMVREPEGGPPGVACHNLEAAGRRHTGLPARNDNGDRRIALDTSRTKNGNNSELRSSLQINTREFLRAVRVSRHSLYAQALDRCSYLGSKARTTATRFPPDKHGKTILNGACS